MGRKQGANCHLSMLRGKKTKYDLRERFRRNANKTGAAYAVRRAAYLHAPKADTVQKRVNIVNKYENTGKLLEIPFIFTLYEKGCEGMPIEWAPEVHTGLSL